MRTVSLVSVELEAQPAGTIASPPGYVELPFEFDLGGEALRDSYEGSLFGVRSVNIVPCTHTGVHSRYYHRRAGTELW